MFKEIQNNIILAVADAADSHINGAEYTKNLDKVLDERLKNKIKSERLQRGPISNFIHEMQLGLYDEDKNALALRYRRWADEIDGTIVNSRH